MLRFRKKYKSVLGIILIVLLYRYDLLLFPEKTNEPVGEIFLMHMFGGSYDMEKANLTVSMVGLIGIIYLSLLFADYIISDLRESAEYIFTRYRKREKWYLKKLGGLFGYCNVGIFLYMFFYIWNAIYESEKHIEKKDVFLILCTYIMLLLFSYCLILGINLASLYFDTTIGFILCYSIVIISSMGMILFQKIPNKQLGEILHKLNPMSNVLVSWNFNDAYIIWGLIYYVLLVAALAFLLWNKVKHYEIGIGLKRYGRKCEKNV